MFRPPLLLGRDCGSLPFAWVIARRYRPEEAGQALADVEALSVTRAIIPPNNRATKGLF